jgi:hypothetical protein
VITLTDAWMGPPKRRTIPILDIKAALNGRAYGLGEHARHAHSRWRASSADAGRDQGRCLFDHLVGTAEERQGEGEAERLHRPWIAHSAHTEPNLHSLGLQVLATQSPRRREREAKSESLSQATSRLSN